MKMQGVLALALGWAVIAAGGAAAQEAGYLAPAQLPDAARLVGPPPAEATGTLAGDLQTYHATRALNGSERWALAVRDADYGPGPMMRAFSCALGVSLTPDKAPALNRLLGRLAVDADTDEHAAKKTYRRPRPFLADGGPICVAPEDWLKKGFSYPSGHAAYGWSAGLVLAEIAPDRSGDVLARARSYGESRVVCGVHYESDIAAGREVGAAVFSALQDDPAFKADLEAARAELARLRAAPAGQPDPAECRVEDDAAAHPVR
jgi:acid phosphatase (class A)